MSDEKVLVEDELADLLEIEELEEVIAPGVTLAE